MLPITLNDTTENLINIKGLNRKRKVNGEKTIKFSVIPNEYNEHAFVLVEPEAIFKFKGEEYVIKSVNERNYGLSTIKHVDAVHKFFDDLINIQQHDLHNGSMTFDAALTFVFEDTGYSFIVLDSFLAQPFENFGRDNRLALFETVLQRYGAEFYITGNTVYLKREIGVKTDFQYRYGMNIKSIDKQISTKNINSWIRGYGGKPDDDGNYPIEEVYISPNYDNIGDKEAKAYYNENITTVDGMQSKLQQLLVDEPQLSLKVDIVQIPGYTHNIANEGDYGYIIYEPMKDLIIEARVVELDELFKEVDGEWVVDKTNVTLANPRRKTTDRITRLEQTSKSYQDLLDGIGTLPISVLDQAVRRATEMLLGSATELEYTENGLVARSKINPDHLVLVSSAGVGVSVDNGQTFREAITGEGIVADLIVVGTMLFDRIKGGTLTLGGPDNGNGRMLVLNENGEVNADVDGNNAAYENLYASKFESPTVVNYSAKNFTFYVSDKKLTQYTGAIDPNDDNDGTSWSEPLATINEALRRIPLYYDGSAKIWLNSGGTHYGDVVLRGFVGRGRIEIDGQNRTGTKIVGNISAGSNLLNLDFHDFTINGRSGSYAVVSSYQNSYANFHKINLHGNSSDRGFDFLQSGYGQVSECDVQSVSQGILGRYGATVWARDNTGVCTSQGIYAYGGYVVGHGTAPEGNTVNQSENAGGKIFATFDYPYTEPPPPPPEPETTSTWNSTGTYKGDSWRDNFGGQWFTDGYGEDAVVQGYYGGFGIYRGLWFFGSSPSTAVTGKTIKSMRLYAHRKNSGGSGGSVTCYFKPHTYTGRPGSVPSFQSPSTQAAFKWNEAKWITIPSSFYAGFESGSYKGIGIYINSTSEANYAKFFVDAKLEITYE
ncbi:hypothetical protein FZC76_09880 [Sutcliffiella horikoshii]|uniref:Prophage tail endopeptidase domain-containing protein n=1 Tax=Sutcliffiella horikoshii TaxID=79883 RepID=A0A5D4SX76_9BACI|nr:prophage endopeptidase tail family protein [Sutcliffiella horikoshii]TYS68057.1 hypothetical protein FZC76_09880 [Sutcliffiella horikoshii]